MIRICPALMLLIACRPDPGDPSYPDPDAISYGEEDGLLEGPDPYEDGDARLSFGLFYESGYSDLIQIDDVSNHYNVYDGTYSEEVDLQDRIEGRSSTVLVMGTAGWFGGGIHWDGGGDLSDWSTLFVSFRSSAAGLDDFDIRMNGGAEGGVLASDYGFSANGEWHNLAIPLTDFEGAGVDLATLTVPFILIGEGVSEGDELKIDNLYITKD